MKTNKKQTKKGRERFSLPQTVGKLQESMKGLWPFHLQSTGPALPVRGATECCFRYQFAAVK
jgi:hypothetical protein